MRSADQWHGAKVTTYKPRFLLLSVIIWIPTATLSGWLLCDQLARSRFSMMHRGDMVPFAIISLGVIAWLFSVRLKLIIYESFMRVEPLWPLPEGPVEYTWAQIGNVTEKHYFFLGKVLIFYTPKGVKYGAIWLLLWRHSKKLKQSIIETVLQNGGTYTKTSLFSHKSQGPKDRKF